MNDRIESHPLDDRVILLDSGPDRFADRFTAIIDGEHDSALALSCNPYSPQGVYLHIPVDPLWVRHAVDDAEARIQINAAPGGVRRAIEREVACWY